MGNIRFAIIIVTYNRLDRLKTALIKYDEQTKPPAYVLVVDNASTDGTQEYLREWQACPGSKYQRIVVRLPFNTGGSGGYYHGVEEGRKLDCDFLYLTDDDAYPEKDVLEKLEQGYYSLRGKKVVAICTSIINYGKYELGHRCMVSYGPLRIRLSRIPKRDYSKAYFPVDMFAFGGVAVSREASLNTDPPRQEYFICHDDTDYALRIGKQGGMYCFPACIVHHNIGRYIDGLATWKDYYDTRNWIDVVRTHFPRRYYWPAIIDRYLKRCTILAKLFHKRDKSHRAMCLEAIRDAMNSRLGFNEKYFVK